jgi:hypothetical protein
VKLFRKPNSRFYWYDFTVRGHRYRRSTQETKLARAAKAASVKLGSVIEGTDPFPSKPSVLSDLLSDLTPGLRMAGWRRKPRSSIAMAGAYSKRHPLRVCESTKSREISLSN